MGWQQRVKSHGYIRTLGLEAVVTPSEPRAVNSHLVSEFRVSLLLGASVDR